MTAVAVSAFVIEAIRKSVSRLIGAAPPIVVTPATSTTTELPCETNQTAPGGPFPSIWATMKSRIVLKSDTDWGIIFAPFLGSPDDAIAPVEVDRRSRLLNIRNIQFLLRPSSEVITIRQHRHWSATSGDSTKSGVIGLRRRVAAEVIKLRHCLRPGQRRKAGNESSAPVLTHCRPISLS